MKRPSGFALAVTGLVAALIGLVAYNVLPTIARAGLPPRGQIVRDLRAFMCQQASDMMDSPMGQETPGIRELDEAEELRKIQDTPVKVVSVTRDPYERNYAVAVATVPTQMFGEFPHKLLYQRSSGGWRLVFVD
jgi:hypothetical protein